MKPNKFGNKVWLLADADTYYVLCFQVYLGKNLTNSSLGYYVGSEKHICLWNHSHQQERLLFWPEANETCSRWSPNLSQWEFSSHDADRQTCCISPILTTNTSPKPDIYATQQVVQRHGKQVVPTDVVKKLDVVNVYNGEWMRSMYMANITAMIHPEQRFVNGGSI